MAFTAHLDGMCLLSGWSPMTVTCDWNHLHCHLTLDYNRSVHLINKCYRSSLETIISSLQYSSVGFWTVLFWFCSFCYCCCCCCFSLSVACYVISGSINCLTFHDNTHMLSASEDRTISVWECQKWECLKVLKGHR